ncbi:MAG: hypothetical protein JXM69_07605 [Anaerolineae bacterium]|nr:hypothetical protein [Anaerolineae bacterium]
MVGIDSTALALLVIGLFALIGFLKGWWKEAITTVFLAILVFFLLVPEAAQLFINAINSVIAFIWQILPSLIIDFLNSGLGTGVSGDVPPQLNAGSSQTWIIILIIFIGLAILIGRVGLPNSGRRTAAYNSYLVTCGGALFGGLLGALNGWLIISLVRAYLQGSKLPGGGEPSMASTAFSAASPGNDVVIQAVDVPTATILDSFLPWLFAAIGLAVFIAALKSRYGIHEQNGYRKIAYKSPAGHERIEIGS